MSSAPAGPIVSSGEYIPIRPGPLTTLAEIATAIESVYRSLARLARRVTLIKLGGDVHAEKAGDLDAVTLRVVSPATPDEEFEVAHFLGRAPTNIDTCVVYGLPGVFYVSGEPGAGGMGPVTIKLKCSQSNCTAVLRVY